MKRRLSYRERSDTVEVLELDLSKNRTESHGAMAHPKLSINAYDDGQVGSDAHLGMSVDVSGNLEAQPLNAIQHEDDEDHISLDLADVSVYIRGGGAKNIQIVDEHG
jgi:uncharacterized protein (DUF1684 family)